MSIALEMATKKSTFLNIRTEGGREEGDFSHFLILLFQTELCNAIVRPDILTKVCTITRTIFKAYVRMNDVQRTVL